MNNNFIHTLPSNYPVQGHITIHYQNINNPGNDDNTNNNNNNNNNNKNNNNNTGGINSNESADTSLSPLTSSLSTPISASPVCISPSLHVVQTVLNISNQNNNNNDNSHGINQRTRKYPVLINDLEQCQSPTDSTHFNFNYSVNDHDLHAPVIRSFARRFTEPVYTNRRGSQLENTFTESNSISSSNINTTTDDNSQIYSPHLPCTRHHHRRNTIAIKFNKPLYKECLTNK